jgi:hypothetical protein
MIEKDCDLCVLHTTDILFFLLIFAAYHIMGDVFDELIAGFVHIERNTKNIRKNERFW